MKKIYEAPTVSVQDMQLGVFGDYGDGNGDGGNIHPVKIIDRFGLRME